MEEFADTPAQKFSYASWVINSMGWPTLHLLLCLTIIAFALLTLVSTRGRGRGPARPMAILLLIPLPLFAGCLISLGATIHWLRDDAMDRVTTGTAELVSRALLSIMVSATCTLPTLVLGLIALFESEPCSTPAAKEPANG